MLITLTIGEVGYTVANFPFLPNIFMRKNIFMGYVVTMVQLLNKTVFKTQNYAVNIVTA